MTTAKSTLPQYDGKPVPWVVRHAAEANLEPVASLRAGNGGLRLTYRDGRENREASGILWMREGITRSGAPEFSQVNVYRQRASMTRGKCQVCGLTIDERPIRWLMATAQLEHQEDGTAHTISPPTCSECIPLALELCPALDKIGWSIVKVLDYSIWGVQGDLVVLDRDGSIRQLNQMRVSYEQRNLHQQVLARQQVAQLNKFVIEETGGGKP